MEEHEQEERELTGGMERALASAVGAAASLLEAYFRRRAREAGRSPAEQSADTETADEHKDLDQEVRAELAVRDGGDGQMWRTASYDEINDHLLREHGIDPRRIGEPASDKEWVTRASGSEILDVYDAAERWADRSPVAAAVRDNIDAELSRYGLDIDEVRAAPRETGAQMIETQRAAHWAEHGNSTDAHRDGRQVQQLLAQADTADRNAERDRSDSDRSGSDRPGAMAHPAGTVVVVDGTLIDTTASRSEQAADTTGTTDAGKAAAVAARDHPTHPRKATTASTTKAAKARPTRTSPARDRSHGR
ncbi:hypothetical protein [Williamsia muralis]|uniref:hypothetical protein n=1 Tax=Williamsia marianensis TaxID=85044 RepID=UPI00381ADEDD